MKDSIEDAIRKTFADLLKSPYVCKSGEFEDKIFTVTSMGGGEYIVSISQNGNLVEQRQITYKMEKI